MTNDVRSEASLLELISRQDLIYDQPPTCWQDGFVLGNGSLGSVFYAPEALEWLVNKTDVIDGRVHGVNQVIPRDEVQRRIKSGAKAHDFEQAERGDRGPEGMGPKTCCRLVMDLGMTAGAGTRSALPSTLSRLSLYDGMLRVELDKHLCHPGVESFVRADEDMLVIRASNVSPIVSFKTRIFFSRPEDIDLSEPRIWQEGSRLMMQMEMPGGGTYVAGLEAAPRPTLAYRDSVLKGIRSKYHPQITGTATALVRGRYGILAVGGDFDLFLTVATNRDSADPAAEVRHRLDLAIATESDKMRATHQAWWHEFWGRSRVELSDKPMEQLFYRSLYALGCTYRKAPLPGLLGLCFGPSVGPLQITPWGGDLHHDLNVQCPMFPVHTLNHSDLFDAYLDSYHAFLPEAQRLAREVWGAKGAHFDMCFTVLGKSIMGGVGPYRTFFGGSYVALMHCLHWRSRRDLDKMRSRTYPFLKEVVAFYQDLMKRGEDGLFHLNPAHACELDVMDTGDPVQVICMLKVCLQTAIEGALALGEKDESLLGGWRELLAHLPEYPLGVDNKGRGVVRDGTGIPPDHHVGQAGCLHPVYPCSEINEFSDPETLRLYQNTLDSVLDKTAQISYANDHRYHYQCVWQCFFRGMAALRLGRVAEFWDFYLPMFLRTYVKPNGLVSHDAVLIASSEMSERNLDKIPNETLLDLGAEMPKFEPWCGHAGGTTPNPEAKKLAVALIEGSADYLTMISECLLQSHNGIIRVFPAWPTDQSASFEDWIADGDIKVSSAVRLGVVSFIKLIQGPNCRQSTIKIKSPWTGNLEDHEFPENGTLVLKR